MADKIIIDSTTRIIRCVTTEDNPVVTPNELVIPVNFLVNLSGRFKKLLQDNQTIVDSTAQEQSDYFDILEPKRVKRRQLLAHIDTMTGDGTLPAKVRTFVSLLKDIL